MLQIMLIYPPIFVKFAQAGSFKKHTGFPQQENPVRNHTRSAFLEIFSTLRLRNSRIPASAISLQQWASSEPALNIDLRLKKIPS